MWPYLGKIKFMKIYSKQKYPTLDSTSVSHDGLTIEEIILVTFSDYYLIKFCLGLPSG